MKTRYEELIEELGALLAKDMQKDLDDEVIFGDQDIGDWIIEGTQVNEDLSDAILAAME